MENKRVKFIKQDKNNIKKSIKTIKKIKKTIDIAEYKKQIEELEKGE